MINPSPIMSNSLTSENDDLSLSPWEKWLLNNEFQKRHNIIHPAILRMKSMSSLEKEKMKSEKVTTVRVRHDLFTFSRVKDRKLFSKNSVLDSLYSFLEIL